MRIFALTDLECQVCGMREQEGVVKLDYDGVAPETVVIRINRHSLEGRRSDNVLPDPSLTLWETAYSLRAVLLHQGSSVHCGHYIIYMRSSRGWEKRDDGSCALCGDDEVPPCDPSEVYVLVYKKHAALSNLEALAVEQARADAIRRRSEAERQRQEEEQEAERVRKEAEERVEAQHRKDEAERRRREEMKRVEAVRREDELAQQREEERVQAEKRRKHEEEMIRTGLKRPDEGEGANGAGAESSKAGNSVSNKRKQEESDGSDISDSSSEENDGLEEIYFNVAVDAELPQKEPVEQDIIRKRCIALRQCMRQRSCLPTKKGGEAMTYDDVASGAKLPLYTCPYLDCTDCFNDRTTFLHHIAGGVSDRKHFEILDGICKSDLSWMTRLDYVYGAVAVAERERWPRLGLCTTRRSLNALCQRYNDDKVQCLACFICCQLRTTAEGFPAVDLETPATEAPVCQHEISMRSSSAFQQLERDRPGSLLNNCSYDLWRRRYVLHRRKGTTNPLLSAEPVSAPLSACAGEEGRHISEWAVEMPAGKGAVLLFGCTEDVLCGSHDHDDVKLQELEKAPYVRRMCPQCSIPVCHDCWSRLYKHVDGGTIPMSLSNDHYYGYVDRFLVENQVTWLECAASSVCWSTMLVYYLEDHTGI